jgi:hypothetical protein
MCRSDSASALCGPPLTEIHCLWTDRGEGVVDFTIAMPETAVVQHVIHFKDLDTNLDE